MNRWRILEVADKTHRLPSRKTPLTSSFFRVESFRFHIMGNGMQRIITSRSILDEAIPTRNTRRSLQWFVNTKFGSHAADIGEQRKSSAKKFPHSHVMHKKPTIRIALLRVMTVLNIRWYKSRMEILTAVMVKPYVIIASILYFKHWRKKFSPSFWAE